MSEHLKDLLSTMLTLDPVRRATLSQVWTHRWVTGSLAATSFRLPAPLLERNGSSGYIFDPTILDHMTQLGISTSDVIHSLNSNDCNQVTATYFLLAEAKNSDSMLPRIAQPARDLGAQLVQHAQGMGSSHGFSLDVNEPSDRDDPSHFAPPRRRRAQ
jgi:serine/threonine protein kinase